MIRYANVDGEIRPPESHLKGACPACGDPVIAKCGPIKMHHWAHLKRMDCDRWWEPMTQWHLDWQDLFPIDWREKVLRDDETGEFHRADIRTPQGITIEFQHYYLSLKELLSRNNFYKKLIWVVDAQGFKNNIRLNAAIPNPRSPVMVPFNFAVSYEGLASSAQYYVKEDLPHGPLVYGKGLSDGQREVIAECLKNSPETYWLFDWSFKHRSWINSDAPVFLDFGNDTLYWIRKREQVGTGLLYLQKVNKQDFIAKYTTVSLSDNI